MFFKGVNFITDGNSSMDLSESILEYCGIEIKPGNREITEELWSSVTDYLDIIKNYYLSFYGNDRLAGVFRFGGGPAYLMGSSGGYLLGFLFSYFSSGLV